MLISNISFGQYPHIDEVRLWDNSWTNSLSPGPSQGNFYDANGLTGVNASSTLQPGTSIRIIVSSDPITSGDIIPNCGEVEDYMICEEKTDCECVNGGEIYTWNSSNCAIEFYLGGWGIDGCATLQPGVTWNFGDNSIPVTTTNFRTYYTYANPETYTVAASFVVIDNVIGEPCTQTYSTTIKVGECGKENISNVNTSKSANVPPIDLFNVNAFPNPSEDFVTFTFDQAIPSQDSDVKPELVIYDQMGREVHRSIFDQSTQQSINFRDIGRGFYLYRITQNGQLIGDGEVIIK